METTVRSNHRASASLPYGDDGDLRIRSLAEAVAEMEAGTAGSGPDPITAKLGGTSSFSARARLRHP